MEDTAAVVRMEDSLVVAEVLHTADYTDSVLVCSQALGWTGSSGIVAVLVVCRSGTAGMADHFWRSMIERILGQLHILDRLDLNVADTADHILGPLREDSCHNLAVAARKLAVEDSHHKGCCLAARRRYSSS